MPYTIRKVGTKWCVYGPSGKHGCHGTRAEAVKQQRALYAAEAAVLADGPDVSRLAMVAVYPRPGEAAELAVDGGEPADDIHCTLVFLGAAARIDVEAVTAAVGKVAIEMPPLEGTIGGVGHFSEGEDGFPRILLPDVKGLTLLRERIVDELSEIGVVSPSLHGFLPHITQVYVDAIDEIGPTDDLGKPVHFDAVSVVAAGERYDYALEGTRADLGAWPSTVAWMAETIGDHLSSDTATALVSLPPTSDKGATLAATSLQEVEVELVEEIAEGIEDAGGSEGSKTSIWNLRIAPETKRLWSEAADAHGVSLSEYVREIVTERALGERPAETEEVMTALETEAAVEEAAVEEATDEVETRYAWEGVLGTIGAPTTDGRYLVPDQVSNRDLPVELHMQPALAEGHDGALPAGSINALEYIPFAQFERAVEFYDEDQLSTIPETALVIFGRGELNGPHADEAKRRIENGADVSMDGLRFDGKLYDSETYELVDAELGMEEVFAGLNDGSYLQGMSGEIGGVTIVSMGAYKEARIITASGSLAMVDENQTTAAERFAILVAAAGPLKPPREWFENPHLKELTPLRIDKDGRVYGHLADWNGCHTGFMGVCVPPFHSLSDYGYFNVGEIETAEGDLMPCGKLMFAMDGAGHAPTDPRLTYIDIQRYYDDATKVGAFVRAGSDRFGTWLAGALRPGVSEIEIQHLRTHPPSGDWRPIRGGDSDLIAAFSVPIPGYPIPRPEALVASAGGSITAIITAPLTLDEVEQKRTERRRLRLQQEMGTHTPTPAEVRRELTAWAMANGPWDDGLSEMTISAADRRRYAKSGAALEDGSFPITKCSGSGPSAENAIRAQGRAKNQDAVVAHIRKRVAALGCSGDLFDDYK